ncbi:MAG: UDP-N-acetylglucosamine 2-epimerase (non-hydrolyzing) [Candidatus Methanoperedenaceae archaeon]|nr:UDP-N-acetylglucosamine 2-epimerase (non-hydrolyzing) [Candidatus Methanoperedenaceae archaeon]
MKIISIVGARPQFIKCAPLSKELRKTNEEKIINTGQHYDLEMSEIFFKELDIPHPDYNLGIGSGTHGEQTGRMLIEIEKILIQEKPDLVLVYGDTNSTIAGALAASKIGIRVAHVEAGLRSFDRSMPEEINRILTDHISNLLFCPTPQAVTNLKNEGIVSGVHMVGDVMQDALLIYSAAAGKVSNIIKKLDLKVNEYFVITVHRPGNTDNKENLRSIIEALKRLEGKVVFPVHPRTEKYLKEYGFWEKMPSNVIMIKPLGYLDMLHLMNNADKILTDSGGIQKEAYMLGKPCITLRENTEWVETVDAGWNVLVGADEEMIVDAVNHFDFSKRRIPLYGENVCKKIVEIINN